MIIYKYAIKNAKDTKYANPRICDSYCCCSVIVKLTHNPTANIQSNKRFGLDESDQRFFCNEKDDKDHFLSCSQASGMGEATRNILSELSPDKKEVSWQQIGSLELHLPPVQRLPALILISELGLEIHSSRAKKKKLGTGILTSNLRFRAEVIGNSRKHQFELTYCLDRKPAE